MWNYIYAKVCANLDMGVLFIMHLDYNGFCTFDRREVISTGQVDHLPWRTRRRRLRVSELSPLIHKFLVPTYNFIQWCDIFIEKDCDHDLDTHLLTTIYIKNVFSLPSIAFYSGIENRLLRVLAKQWYWKKELWSGFPKYTCIFNPHSLPVKFNFSFFCSAGRSIICYTCICLHVSRSPAYCSVFLFQTNQRVFWEQLQPQWKYLHRTERLEKKIIQCVITLALKCIVISN